MKPLAREIGDAIGRISVWPETAPVAEEREHIRVLTLMHHPYRIFYRVRRDAVEILHIRHSSRAPWLGGR